jgi:hypothetical protein
MDFLVLVLFLSERFLVLFEIPNKDFLSLKIIFIGKVFLTSVGKLRTNNLVYLKTAQLRNVGLDLFSQFGYQVAYIIHLPDIGQTRLLNFSIFVER